MVVIRLTRGGSKKRPHYHMIATDSRSGRDGRYLERLGYFNPIASGQDKKLELNRDRITYWLERGAKKSDRAHALIMEWDKLS